MSASTQLTIGRSYYGPGGARLTVMSVEGETVHVLYPISLRRDTRTVAEMLEFIKGDPRRTYTHSETGELRTKLRVEEDGSVVYHDPIHIIGTASAKEWAAWRKQA